MIPEEWRAALDENPTCMVLRGALADWMEEHDRPLAAEALRWSIAKRVSPCTQGDGWFWIYEKYPFNFRLPPNFSDKYAVADAIDRLIYTWEFWLGPLARTAAWDWQPKGATSD